MFIQKIPDPLFIPSREFYQLVNEHILIVGTEVEGGEIFFVKHLEVVETKKGHESLCVAN